MTASTKIDRLSSAALYLFWNSAQLVTLRHKHSENGIVKAMMMYDNIVSRKPQKLFSMTAALSTTSISNIGPHQ